jgi:predicted Rossmann fold flavoprotein
LGQSPHFCRSALSRYTPADVVALLNRHGVPWHEKHQGQLFCDRSAQDLIDVLLRECDAGGVVRRHGCAVKSVNFSDSSALFSGGRCYELLTSSGPVCAPKLVVATGGLSIPAIGASAWGHDLAQQFGLRLVPTRPALVPLTFEPQAWATGWAALSGLSLPVDISTGSGKTGGHFREDLLFTHRGLSGPAVLQISSYWREGSPLHIDLAPDTPLQHLLHERKALSRKRLDNELATWLPSRLANHWVQADPLWQRPTNEVPDKALQRLCDALHRWALVPTGTEGYRKAEVTLGGVDTRDLSSQTLESKQPGLYFIGEVVDVTGWLGGYNFQWAWASAHACAVALSAT